MHIKYQHLLTACAIALVLLLPLTLAAMSTIKRHEGARFTTDDYVRQAYEMGFCRGVMQEKYGNIPQNVTGASMDVIVDRQWKADRNNLMLGRALTDNEWDRK